MMPRTRRLALFAKRPEQDRVKTRMSPALPPVLATDLYRGMVEDTLETLTRVVADARCVYWADLGPNSVAVPHDVGVREQTGDHLGSRLEHAFDELCAGGGHAVVIGADCPQLGAAAIERAFGALERSDLVLGPTRDGGYYLIGLARAAPELFRDIAWSTEYVLRQTIDRAQRTGLAIEQLEPLADLDTAADLIGFLRHALAEPECARQTRAALQRMALLPA